MRVEAGSGTGEWGVESMREEAKIFLESVPGHQQFLTHSAPVWLAKGNPPYATLKKEQYMPSQTLNFKDAKHLAQATKSKKGN